MGTLDTLLGERLARIERAGRLRQPRPTRMLPGGRALREGREYLDFSSNDYLGLALHPLLIERAREAAARAGTGSGASRLVTGLSEELRALEARLAAFKGTEAALVFASGWQANAATIPALLAAMPGAAVFADRLVHASMHAGLAMAGARQHRFRHNDLDHLEALLAEKGAEAPARVILAESIYSMDGDGPDLARLSVIARRHDAILYVDEAHATGVLGPRGAGLSASVPGAIEVIMGTFGKALGGFGAYVAGSRRLCDYLVNAASGMVFSTALPPAAIGAIDAALDLVPDMDAERAHLTALGDRLRAGLNGLGVPSGASVSQIVPVIVGAESAAMRLSEALLADGMLASAIRPPTVAKNTSRLRIALKATHSAADVDRLLAVLGRAL
ncbi:8-amino-7-oxononanoate synthase [Novosphingobium sp. PC22D]|uniref:aminotransferase class I/II-fold pyridoxal phosphate-dependent enzyme n=1 Tax=Novosphingobium sp. PC22D TaxID=1962403 RepID=UPI000BF12ABC|nr:8-amino-7-oxononanoate synthase [Novosphingobium sp. PC22D]PEQ12729.1 8-amino-7-oxononanoate synthase [Novosphingobium sp. PC22D]